MAHIISFPNSAAAPVQQKRGPGRHPKMVVQLWKWRNRARPAIAAHSAEFLIGVEQGRRAAEAGMGAASTRQSLYDQLASERELLSIFEGTVNNLRQKVAVLQQQCAQAAGVTC